MSYVFKFKSAFGNHKRAFKNINSALFLLSAPCLFLNLGETLYLQLLTLYLREKFYDSSQFKMHAG